MKNGYMSDKELNTYLDKMHHCAEQMPIATPFVISDLLSAEEWQQITQYGHITLGQYFKSRVDTGKVKNVYSYSEGNPREYIRK